jgi:hypothetical protein
VATINKNHFSLEKRDMGYVRGLIGAKVIEKYIQRELISALIKKEGWDGVFYIPEVGYNSNYFSSFLREKSAITEFFLDNGLFPTDDFLSYFEKLIGTLDYTPDGFLIKVKKIRETTLESALKKFNTNVGNIHHFEFPTQTILPNNQTITRFMLDEKTIDMTKNKTIFVVDGKVDAIEIKFTKQLSLQNPSYKKILSAGYIFRLFHVKIISLEEFEIEERVFTNPNELNNKRNKG